MDLSNRITRGVLAKPLRCVLYGVEAIGKSSFAAQFPNCVFLAAEDGTSYIDTQRIVPTDWHDAMNILDAFIATPPGQYQTISIDTADWLMEMATGFICQREKVSNLEEIPYGRWKRMLMDEFLKFLNKCRKLYNAGYNVNIIAHATINIYRNPEGDDYDRFNIAIPNKHMEQELRQWADIVGFFNYDTSIVETVDGMRTTKKAQSRNARRMYLNRSVAFDAKNRLGMPDFIDLGSSAEEGFKKFWNLYQASLQRISQNPAVVPPAEVVPAPAATMAPPPPPPPAQ